MDKTFLKQLKAELKDEMKAMGFKVRGQWYVRVIDGQVAQHINFQGGAGGDYMFVNFAVTPLISQELGYWSNVAVCRLESDAPAGEHIGYGEWDYSEESLKDIVRCFREILFPFLEQCRTNEGILRVVKPYLEDPEADPAKAGRYAQELYYVHRFNLPIFDRLLILFEEYELCRRYLEFMLNWQTASYEGEVRRQKERADDPDPDERRRKFQEDIDKNTLELYRSRVDQVRDEMDLVEHTDRAVLLQEMENNRQKNLTLF